MSYFRYTEYYNKVCSVVRQGAHSLDSFGSNNIY